MSTLFQDGLRNNLPVDFVTYNSTGSVQTRESRTKIESLAYYGAVLLGISQNRIHTEQMNADEAFSNLSNLIAVISSIPRGQGGIPYSFYQFNSRGELEQDSREANTQGMIDNAILISFLLAVAGSEVPEVMRTDLRSMILAMDYSYFLNPANGLIYGDQNKSYHLDLNNDESALATLIFPVIYDTIPDSTFTNMDNNDIADYDFSHITLGTYRVPKTWNGHQEQNALPVMFLGYLGIARFLNALASGDYFLEHGFIPGPGYGRELPATYVVMGIPDLAHDTSPYPEEIYGVHYTLPLTINTLLEGDNEIGRRAAYRIALRLEEILPEYQRGERIMDSQGSYISGPIKLSIGILAASQAVDLFNEENGWLSAYVRNGLRAVGGESASSHLQHLIDSIHYAGLEIPVFS
jgi:hypothetical protein